MNTVEAIILSQLPIAIVGILLWREVRMIRADLIMKNNTDEDLLHNSSKEAS